jgi:AcrR family transcriptional regulator
MGSNERREREKQELRRKILETARKMFLAEGYEAVTMRKIAQKIEYSPTAIYLHFKDKDALFGELCRQDFLRLAQALSGIAQIKDPIEQLRRMGRAYLDFALEFPNHYRLMFMTPHPVEPEGMEGLQRGNPEEDAYAFLKQIVAGAIKAGRFRPEYSDAELIAQTFWAGVHGVASLQIAKHGDQWVDWRPITKRAEMMIESQLHGMLKPNGSGKRS